MPTQITTKPEQAGRGREAGGERDLSCLSGAAVYSRNNSPCHEDKRPRKVPTIPYTGTAKPHIYASGINDGGCRESRGSW